MSNNKDLFLLISIKLEDCTSTVQVQQLSGPSWSGAEATVPTHFSLKVSTEGTWGAQMRAA